jgi:hypothetical protein
MRHYAIALLPLAAAVGCAASRGGAPDLAPAPDLGDVAANLRGARYCEVLVANVAGANIHVDVYNTQGLNDCPDAAWTQLDAATLQAQLGASMVLLNGPRYWMLDAFVRATLIDPTPRMFGALAMRHAGSIDLPLAGATMLGNPYLTHQIQRDTVVRFSAGKPLFELVDATGRVFEMQSYSVQKTPLTEADLPSLGSRLTPPQGWSFRTRTLPTDLLVTAVGGVATVVQDDFADTYQLAQ